MKKHKEFTCIVCGKRAIDKGTRQNAKFCSEKCRNRHRYMSNGGKKAQPSCEYNKGVSCSKQECDRCGWNPSVERMRKEDMLCHTATG